MDDFVEVGKRADLASGQMKMVNVDGAEVLLARVGDDFYATQNRCNHMGGNLSAGTLAGTIVTCPRHHSQYDLRDGRVVRWTDWTGVKLFFARVFKPPKALATYPVKLDGDRVLVRAKPG